MPVSCIRPHLLQETKILHRPSYSLEHNLLERGFSLALAGVSDDERAARSFARISALRINPRSVLTINLFDTALSTRAFAARRSVNVARSFGDALVTSNLPNCLRERRHNRKKSSKKQGISVKRCSHYYRDRKSVV